MRLSDYFLELINNIEVEDNYVVLLKKIKGSYSVYYESGCDHKSILQISNRQILAFLKSKKKSGEEVYIDEDTDNTSSVIFRIV